MVADLQSRIERSFPPQSHQHLGEGSGMSNGTALQDRLRRSDRPRTPGKKSIPLLNRIQMHDLTLGTLNTSQKEKSLIERIAAPDDMDSQIYRPTARCAPRQERPGLNGKLIGENVGSRHANHKKRPQNASHARNTSIHVHEQRNSQKASKDLRSHPFSTVRDDNVIIPNQDSTHTGGSASFHHIHRSPDDNRAFPSVSPKAFVDHLLPLAQQIADVRMEHSQVGTPPNGFAVNSRVITAEVLAQFNQQLINLRKELHHHQEQRGPQMFAIEESQDTSISADDDESRSSLGTSLNGHGHNPVVSELEGTIPHEPSEIGTTEPPQPLRDERTPTPEHREKRRPSSSFISPLPHRSPKGHPQPDPGRRYLSSELRDTSKDFRQYDRRTERRSWDHYDYRQLSSSKSRREDSDRRYRRSISPKRRRTPYSPSMKDRRNSSPSRYRRRGSPSSHRRRSPFSPERRRLSSEKSKDSIPRHTESVSNHIKEPSAQADGSDSMSLQDLLQSYRGIASSQQGTRTISELNVPGVWFAFQGSQEIGMSTIEFEFDEQTAQKWNLQSNKGSTTPQYTESLFNDQDRLQPSLEVFCFSLHDVQMTMQNLGRDSRSHDLVKALSSLENTWPPQGQLIISVNAESQNQKSWFPDTFRQKDSIKLEEFLRKGINLVKFIHLSDLSGKMLVLLATANGIQNDYTRLKFLLPERGGGAPFPKAIQIISKG